MDRVNHFAADVMPIDTLHSPHNVLPSTPTHPPSDDSGDDTPTHPDNPLYMTHIQPIEPKAESLSDVLIPRDTTLDGPLTALSQEHANVSPSAQAVDDAAVHSRHDTVNPSPSHDGHESTLVS
jgi:hypothetical protein